LLSLAQVEARDRHAAHVVIAAAPLVATGYSPRYGSHPYYDAGFVWGIDGFNRTYYDGWRTRAPWYGRSACGHILERRTVQRGRMIVRKYCVE
jgi:hypothetical protein